MPQLLNGKWVNDDVAANEMKNGSFHREPTRFRHWLSADGAPGPDGQEALQAVPGRFQLFVSYMCPWASRTLIMRKLKGLEDMVPVAVAEPFLGDNGWEYTTPADAGPKVAPISYQHQLYTASELDYSGKVSVPVLWDRQEGRIVNNESADIIRMFNDAFDGLIGNHLDFYPTELRPQIDKWNEIIYDGLNNGVYRAGFAKSQTAYDKAVADVFATLDTLEAHLVQSRYLAGAWLTEADVRLFVTLVRFDPAYHGLFKCNIRPLSAYAALSGYLREIYQWPGVADTVKIDHIKRGYYSVRHLNPSGIVPSGPVQDLMAAHGRGGLPGEGIRHRA